LKKLHVLDHSIDLLRRSFLDDEEEEFIFFTQTSNKYKQHEETLKLWAVMGYRKR